MDTDNEPTEKVYERALMIELQRRGVRAASEAPIPVNYKGQFAGEYFADLLVEGSLVLELKCFDRLAEVHMAQSLNYLKSSGLPLCLLVNFHTPKAGWPQVHTWGSTEHSCWKLIDI